VSERDLGATAEELRRVFDAAFAAPPPAARRDLVALLGLRVGGERVAVRVLETAGLVQARKIVPVPSRRAELLGVSGLRGAVVPIFALSRLLGRPDDGEPRWVVLAGGAERVGLAVAALDRHLVVPAQDLAPAPGGDDPGAHVRELASFGGDRFPVLNVPALVRSITGA
jgi:purine-binding chemotaxis protein CheW